MNAMHTIAGGLNTELLPRATRRTDSRPFGSWWNTAAVRKSCGEDIAAARRRRTQHERRARREHIWHAALDTTGARRTFE